MKEKEAAETLRKICPTCGKPVADARRSGSLTAFLFGASACTCSRDGDPAKAAHSSSTGQAGGEVDFCPKCGLQIVTDSRDGSLTGFLFQSTRCKCPPDKAFADGEMSAKFWKLKEAGSGTIFMSAATESSRAAARYIDLAPGAIIGGVYKVIELIGRGGMGEVYLARHEALGKKCALKVIPPEQVTEIGWQRFQLEAKAVAKLDHINLVRVTDLGIHEGCLPFYAMDYVEGKNLAELLAEQGPMPLPTMIAIFVQVCDGVECAHRSGILHRDLKPANIMVVTARPGTKQAKVLDFGLAKLTKHDRTKQSLTAVGDVFGSPFYMSPEQCNGDKLDNRSDIYSLGCTMFECLTGQPPFSGHLASAVLFSHLEADPPSLESVVGARRFPPSMEIVMAKLLRKNPVERYQTLSQLKADLELVAGGQDVLPVYRSRDNKDAQVAEARMPVEDTPLIELPDLSIRHVLLGSCIFLILLSVGSAFVWSASRPASHVPRPAKEEIDYSMFQPTNSKSTAAAVLAPANKVEWLKVGYTEQEFQASKDFNLDQLAHDMDSLRQIFPSLVTVKIRAGNHFKREQGKSGFRFFDGISIGAIQIGNHKPVLATGFVPVPSDSSACLYLESTSACAPDLLYLFLPDDLAGLDVVWPHPQEAIGRIAKWNRLKEFSFFNPLLKMPPGAELRDESPMEDRDLASLNKFPALRSLGICGPSLTSRAILSMPMLTKLEALKLKSIQDIRQLLRGLCRMDNLTELWLINEGTDNSQLEILSGMKHLSTLRIRRCFLTPDSVPYFRKMPALKSLSLDCNWSQDEKTEFISALPHCRVEFEPTSDLTFWRIRPSESSGGINLER